MGNSVSIACSTFDTAVVSYKPYGLMIRQMETQTMLIGYARTSTTDQQAGFEAQLLGYLSRDGMIAISEVIRATYNGPLTLPFNRRNEAMVRIDWP